jgi:DNA-binding NarL/FixJ family response regulator
MVAKGEMVVEAVACDQPLPRKDPSVRISVLFVEDNQHCATAFRRVLGQYGFDLIIASTLASARKRLAQLGDDIDAVLLDLDLPDGRGEELLPLIETLSRQPGVVIFSDFLDEIKPEATSYRVVLTPKTIAPASLASILRRSARGYAQCTIERFGKHFGLTVREMETLDCMACGTSPKETAVTLVCSIQSVYAHLARICEKTSCTTYQEVVAMLFRYSCHGLGHAIGVEGRSCGRD